MARLFGTDGVRGVANRQLTCDIAFKLGQAAATFLGSSIVVGKDTRLSGDMLEAAVSAGIMSAGGNALLAGVIPTPGVAFLVNDLHADGGIVISASHNPPKYNGIKIFDADGFKLTDELEDEIERFVRAGGLAADGDDALPEGDQVGISLDIEDACERYIQHAVICIQRQGVDFTGLHIALDAGHGASCYTSAEAFRRLGARVTAINDDYDGCDINVECGSTCLDPIRELVATSGADVGVAHDGDADRVMIVSPEGDEIDGDFMAALLAQDMKKRNRLAHDTVVSTVMCNVGFLHAMREEGVTVVQANVGDRYVLEKMREGGFNLGGEQSGHMIMLDHNSTGDGLMTACQYLAAVVRSGQPVSQAARIMKRYPQVLVNVEVADKEALRGNARIDEAVNRVNAELGDDGRVLVRPSGTEPVVRVMVEAASDEVASRHAAEIAEVVSAELGA